MLAPSRLHLRPKRIYENRTLSGVQDAMKCCEIGLLGCVRGAPRDRERVDLGLERRPVDLALTYLRRKPQHELATSRPYRHFCRLRRCSKLFDLRALVCPKRNLSKSFGDELRVTVHHRRERRRR
jgi:hypothetical protein